VARRQLESGTAAPVLTRAKSPGRPAFQKMVVFSLGAAALALIFLATYGFRHPTEPAAHTVKFTITPNQLFHGAYTEIDTAVFLSTDGKHIAYVARGNPNQLWIRDLDQEQARPVSGATGVYEAFWSPDNQFIGYATGPRCNFLGPCDLVRIPAA